MMIMPDDNSVDKVEGNNNFFDNGSKKNEFNDGTKKKDMFVEKVSPTIRRKPSTRSRYRAKNYPKKALSSYNIFFKETRERILKEHGKTNFQEMVRKIAALWKEITPEDKLRFDAIASRDLARYREEVSEYEQNIVEKSRIKVRLKEELEDEGIINRTSIQDSAFDTTSVGINMKTHRGNAPVQNVQVPGISNNEMIAGNSQCLQIASSAAHTLTSNELQLAQHRLTEEVSATDELTNIRTQQIDAVLRKNKLAPTEGQFYNLGLGFARDHQVPSGEAVIGNQIALDLHGFNGNAVALNAALDAKNSRTQDYGSDPSVMLNSIDYRKRLSLDMDTLETRNKIERINRIAALNGNDAVVPHGVGSSENFGLGADSIATLNQSVNHPNEKGEDPMLAYKKEEFRNLVREAQMPFLRSTAYPDGIRLPHFRTYGNNNNIPQIFPAGSDSTTAFDAMVRSNEAQIRNSLIDLKRKFQRSSNQEQMSRQMRAGGDPRAASAEEVRQRIAIDSVRNQLLTPNTELQRRQAMIQHQELMAQQLGRSARNMGMGNLWGEMHLQETRMLQREHIFNEMNGGATSAVQREVSGVDLRVLEEARRRRPSPPSQGSLTAPGSSASPSLDSSLTSPSLDNAENQSASMKSNRHFSG
jgi:hypothetical protein